VFVAVVADDGMCSGDARVVDLAVCSVAAADYGSGAAHGDEASAGIGVEQLEKDLSVAARPLFHLEEHGPDFAEDDLAAWKPSGLLNEPAALIVSAVEASAVFYEHFVFADFDGCVLAGQRGIGKAHFALGAASHGEATGSERNLAHTPLSVVHR